MDINASSPDISSDQNSGLARSELFHDSVPLFLGHISMHRRNGEIGFTHFFCQPVDLPLCVAKNDSLGNCQGIIQIAQCVKFPFLPLNGNEKLFDTYEIWKMKVKKFFTNPFFLIFGRNFRKSRSVSNFYSSLSTVKFRL